VPATTLDRPIAIGSAQDILARLERYAAAQRAAWSVAPAFPRVPPPVVRAQPAPRAGVHPLRIGPALLDAASVDLFPYDLAATVAGCAATILASIAFARPLALLCAAGLALSGEWARRYRWFPSVGTNLILGTAVGVVLVLTA
jgi:hypothetical protein